MLGSRVIVTTILLTVLANTQQQPLQNAPEQQAAPAVDRSYEFVFQLYMVRPKSGMQHKFEEALKEHFVWLRQHRDSWGWTTWQMLSGDHFGEYGIGTFHHRWKDFDEHNELTQSEQDQWDTAVAPYVDRVTCTYYKQRPELSYERAQAVRPLYQGLKFVHVKLDRTTEFGQSVKKMQEALEKTNVTGSSLWYQMIRGAEHPLYLWVMPMKSLAELEPPKGQSVPALVLQYYGQKEGTSILEAMVNTVQVYNSEISRIRPDLSYVPEGR
jgi:hypothetical protein